MGSIWRNSLQSMSRSGTPTHVSSGAVAVRCPKCQAKVVISGLQEGTPVRCGKCHYPFVLRRDLMRIIAACMQAGSSGQTPGCVPEILKKLSVQLPEAGTALGMLGDGQAFQLNETDRWSFLISAYSRGDRHAQEGLNKICQSDRMNYERRICKSCGAPKYIDKRLSGRTRCVFCQSTD